MHEAPAFGPTGLDALPSHELSRRAELKHRPGAGDLVATISDPLDKLFTRARNP